VAGIGIERHVGQHADAVAAGVLDRPDRAAHQVVGVERLATIRGAQVRLGVGKERVPSSLRLFGNTSCASIPVTLSCCLREQLQNSRLRLAMLGFGVGWSWAGCAVEIGPTKMPEPAFI
jgi:3-oxoacyl-[acyl-carrier-protein] synthase III